MEQNIFTLNDSNSYILHLSCTLQFTYLYTNIKCLIYIYIYISICFGNINENIICFENYQNFRNYVNLTNIQPNLINHATCKFENIMSVN